MKNNQLGMGPGLPLVSPTCITIKELKELVKDLPEVDPDTGDDYELWMATGPNESMQVRSIWQLNKGDIIVDINR